MRFLELIVMMVILSSVILYGQSKSLYQFLENWPAGCDTTGKHWVVYNINKAETHYVADTSVSSVTTTTLWMAQIGNFNGGVNPWLPGNTLVALGSIDTAYIHNPGNYINNVNHTGFYWLFSDTITSATPEAWLPADTLRVMPKPIVSQTGAGAGANDTIWVKIPNPNETRRADQTEYDVMGFYLVADSTGTGTPNALDAGSVVDIGFVAVQGDTADTTVFYCLESDYFLPWTHWTTYFAYKIVARPDTVDASADTMGYTTYYWSQNSDAIDVYQNVVGSREGMILKPGSVVLQSFPNPFKDKIEFLLAASDVGGVEFRVYNISGELVAQFVNESSCNLVWYGTDNSGKKLSPGVYFVRISGTNIDLTEKVVIER